MPLEVKAVHDKAKQTSAAKTKQRGEEFDQSEGGSLEEHEQKGHHDQTLKCRLLPLAKQNVKLKLGWKIGQMPVI